MEEIKIVDAHHHFWDPTTNYHPWLHDDPMIPFRYGDYTILRDQPFLPEDYFREVGSHKVVMTVSMEGEYNPSDPVGESLWMQSIADKHGYPQAHVAQAWLDADNAEEIIRAQAAIPLVKSVRHKPKVTASPGLMVSGAPGSITDPKWQRGYALLSRYSLHFDLQVPWWHLYEAADLAEAYPETIIILNHTGLPADRSAKGLDGWRQAMTVLAARPNTVVKISGLGLPGRPWLVEDNKPVIRETIEIFGTGRCMFGSNFPVDRLVADLDAIFTGFKQSVADLPLEDQKKLFHDNAARVYGLE
jgi:predicted TIM-barrel fold metal-dependent hydrolase